MSEVSVLAILAATVAAFILSSSYYSLFATQLATVSAAGASDESPPPWKLGVEVLRSATLAAAVAGLAAHGEIDDWAGGLVLGLVLWIGFPLVLWTGAIVWENTPVKLAALHGGDWLAKLLIVGLIVAGVQ